MRIGLDFDNTIIRYDDTFQQAAIERRLLDAKFCGNKQQVRDAIRRLPDGEMKWQALQGHVYGKGIAGAGIFDGVPNFLRRARMEGHTVLIVSHKTEYGHFDPERINLRRAALEWMEAQGFFSERQFAIPCDNVYFETTRTEKLLRIASLDCDVFVDDLEEVLADPGFPKSVRRILFAGTGGGNEVSPLYSICADWAAIEEMIFCGRN
jgi:hypothetical protein